MYKGTIQRLGQMIPVIKKQIADDRAGEPAKKIQKMQDQVGHDIMLAIEALTLVDNMDPTIERKPAIINRDFEKAVDEMVWMGKVSECIRKINDTKSLGYSVMDLSRNLAIERAVEIVRQELGE